MVKNIICSSLVLIASLMFAQNTFATDKPVALELVLAADVSSSVNAIEYNLQVTGYVRAFQDENIIAAINALGPGGIAVTYVEWSSRRHQNQVVGWSHITDAESAFAFANAISNKTNRTNRNGTAIGEAILFSVNLFQDNGFISYKRTIDISADDRYNSGSAPSYARNAAMRQGVTVNGLVIDKSGKLAEFFRKNVIGGESSFVMTANTFQDFGTAIKKKLLRELASQALVSSLCPSVDCTKAYMNVKRSRLQ